VLPDTGEGWTVPQGVLATLVGSVTVYAALFAIGYWLYGQLLLAAVLTVVAVLGTIHVVRVWGRLSGARDADRPDTHRVAGA